MEKNISLTFHHIGKPVSLQMIQHNKKTKYSPLFDMYSLNMENHLSIPIEYVLTGKEIILLLYQPFVHYRCAMVSINGQLIEFIETSLSEKEIWGEGIFRDSTLYPQNK